MQDKITILVPNTYPAVLFLTIFSKTQETGKYFTISSLHFYVYPLLIKLSKYRFLVMNPAKDRHVPTILLGTKIEALLSTQLIQAVRMLIPQDDCIIPDTD